MNIFVVAIVSITLIILGIWKGLNPETRTDNIVIRTIFIILFSIGCIHILLTIGLSCGSEVYARYWVKEKMRVVKNPGDGEYYLDLGDRYHELHNFYNTDFEALENDSAVVYRPGPAEIFRGYMWIPATQNVDNWQIRRAEDIIYERLVEQNPQPVELKDQ